MQLVALRAAASPTPTPTVTLAWDPNTATGNPATDTVGYHLRTGFASGQETLAADVGDVTSWTIQLNRGTTYYFEVTAYNAAKVDSPPSNEESLTIP